MLLAGWTPSLETGFWPRHCTGLAPLSAAVIGLVVGWATMNKKREVPPSPAHRPLPPAGGWPEESLALKGRLRYDDKFYKLEVEALPGYVVTLRFATSDLETWAAAHLGQRVTLSGHWDRTDPTVFVVESGTLETSSS
jgi:hypothetical protein